MTLKDLEAWTRGYVGFWVETRSNPDNVLSKFRRYSVAKAATDAVPEDQSVGFYGYNLLRGPVCFYVRSVSSSPTITESR